MSMTPHQPPVLAIQVGNTRIKLGLFKSGDPEEVVFVPREDLAAAIEAATRLFEVIGAEPDASVLVADVDRATGDALVATLRDQLACEVYRVPQDMPVPIGTCLAAGAKPGVDRLLNAAAAYDRLRQACIVIDAGTCITVDFIDGEGVFHGGAIAPGALPAIDFSVPEGTAWGADTREAMVRGVYHGARGLAWRLIEKYAEQYGGFPIVIATGGDAATLFADDELVNQIVPDLVLRGMAIAARCALEPEGADQEGDGEPNGGRAAFGALPEGSDAGSAAARPRPGARGRRGGLEPGPAGGFDLGSV